MKNKAIEAMAAGHDSRFRCFLNCFQHRLLARKGDRLLLVVVGRTMVALTTIGLDFGVEETTLALTG
jgi:hypothetical protein